MGHVLASWLNQSLPVSRIARCSARGVPSPPCTPGDSTQTVQARDQPPTEYLRRSLSLRPVPPSEQRMLGVRVHPRSIHRTPARPRGGSLRPALGSNARRSVVADYTEALAVCEMALTRRLVFVDGVGDQEAIPTAKPCAGTLMIVSTTQPKEGTAVMAGLSGVASP
jgi:hypothetical protein